MTSRADHRQRAARSRRDRPAGRPDRGARLGREAIDEGERPGRDCGRGSRTLRATVSRVCARQIGVGIAASACTAVCSDPVGVGVGVLHSQPRTRRWPPAPKSLQRQVQAGRTAASLASLPPAERAWVSKETSTSSVIVMEALSRALPDAAYLTEIRLEGEDLAHRWAGRRRSRIARAARAVQASDQCTLLCTRLREGRTASCSGSHIEARVEPHIKIGRGVRPAEARPGAGNFPRGSLAAAAGVLVRSGTVAASAFRRRAGSSPSAVRWSHVSKPGRERRRRPAPVAAPPAAFLDAPTQGLASAQLQAYLAQLAGCSARQPYLLRLGFGQAR